MDIVEKLKIAVAVLPEGEHTPGMSAIVRHVENSIRHYERAEKEKDEDAYTDCIYRTNQAYEGSLKEAYRIFSGVKPERKTLNEIETYFGVYPLDIRKSHPYMMVHGTETPHNRRVFPSVS